MRIGIIGCGQLVREVHLPNLGRLKEVEIAAVSDPLIPGSPTVETLLKMALDGVLVASPTGKHAAHARLVLETGLPLYLEKPLASTLAEAQAVAALDHGRATMGFNYRWHPIYRRSLELAQVSSIRSQFSFAPRPLPEWKKRRATGGGVLLDLGSHHIDLICHLLRREPTAVQCRLRDVATEQDDAELTLHFGEETEARCRFSFVATETDFLEIAGRRLDRYAPLRHPWWPPGDWLAYQLERRGAPWKEVSFLRSMEAWIASIRGESPFRAPLSEGLRAMRVIDAAERSAALGSAVPV